MSVPLSEQQLADIHTRIAGATGGPWRSMQIDADTSTVWAGGDTVRNAIRIGRTGKRTDAEFIAHAREDVPVLLTQVERLRVERDQFADRIDKLTAAAKKRRDQVHALKSELSDVRQRAAELERALNDVDTAALDRVARLLSEGGEQS